MLDEGRGIVLVADVIGSRGDLAGASEWLRRLCRELAERYGPAQLAAFDYAQGDELQGLLRPAADPFAAVLHAALHAAARPMRWSIALGPIEPGEGGATKRTGAAFLVARTAIETARRRRDGLVVATGDPRADALLADLAPVLAERLAAMTARQREIARLILLDGRRQAEVAEALGISRASVSVGAGRAGVREARRLLHAVRSVWAEGAGSSAPGAEAR